jgi:hypothetical protein
MPDTVKTQKRRRKPKPRRKTFLIDHDTLRDLGVIQDALRATSSAEALRTAVRKMADLVRAANGGNQIHVVDPSGKAPPIVVDVPHLETGGAS